MVGVKGLESGTMWFVTVTVSVLEEGAVHVPLVKRLYVTVPPALLEAPDSVAVSWTVVPTVTEVTGLFAESLMTVEMVGVHCTVMVAGAEVTLVTLPPPAVAVLV